MKPRELYSGPEPAEMSKMGNGIADAYAKAGAIQGQGYANLGQTIGQFIGTAGQAIGAAYGDYKKMSSQVKADSAAFDTLKDYMPKDVAESFDMQRRAMETDPSTSLQDRASFYNSAKSFLGTSIQHRMDMEKYQKQVEATRQMPFYTMGANALGVQMQNLGRPNKAIGYGGGVGPSSLDYLPQEDTNMPQGYGGYQPDFSMPLFPSR